MAKYDSWTSVEFPEQYSKHHHGAGAHLIIPQKEYPQMETDRDMIVMLPSPQSMESRSFVPAAISYGARGSITETIASTSPKSSDLQSNSPSSYGPLRPAQNFGYNENPQYYQNYQPTNAHLSQAPYPYAYYTYPESAPTYSVQPQPQWPVPPPITHIVPQPPSPPHHHTCAGCSLSYVPQYPCSYHHHHQYGPYNYIPANMPVYDLMPGYYSNYYTTPSYVPSRHSSIPYAHPPTPYSLPCISHSEQNGKSDFATDRVAYCQSPREIHKGCSTKERSDGKSSKMAVGVMFRHSAQKSEGKQKRKEHKSKLYTPLSDVCKNEIISNCDYTHHCKSPTFSSSHSPVPLRHSPVAYPPLLLINTKVQQTRRPAAPKIDRVLEDFKCAKGDGYTFKDILGHFKNFCLDQTGSRFIQEHISMATKEEIDSAFEELEPHSIPLMHDVFGNYIVQLMFDKGDEKQRQKLAYTIKRNMLDLSLHVYGCRVVQRALEVLDDDTKVDLVSQLNGYIVRCIKDMNGNHVIQKAVQTLHLDDIVFITDTVSERVVHFSVHPYGCRIVQRILEREPVNEDQLFRKREIISQVLGNMNELAQDQYGNYVVQHVLQYGEQKQRREGLKRLLEDLTHFACHKFASNVIERGLLCGDEEERSLILEGVMGKWKPSMDLADDPLFKLMTNRFGNYVVQRILEVMSEEQKSKLLSRIMSHLEVIKRFKYGKHIISCVESLLKVK